MSEFAFDPVYYVSAHADLIHLTDRQLRAHWREAGQSEGRTGSEAEAMALLMARPDMPFGFNIGAYLAANHDVRENTVFPSQAIQHYLDHGRREGRPVKGADRDKFIANPAYRLLTTPLERSDWQDSFAALAAQSSVEAVLASHPRRAFLDQRFSLASYLAQNHDLAENIKVPGGALFHYLEFGIEERRSGLPARFDAEFVRQTYGLSLNPHLSPVLALHHLRAHLGATPDVQVYLAENEYLTVSGLFDAAMAVDFDHEFYHANLGHLGIHDLPHGRAGCLRHFVETGAALCLPISALLLFEPAFYLEEYAAAEPDLDPDLLDTDDADERAAAERDLYWHWLSRGMRRNYMPNVRAMVAKFYGVDLPPAITAQAASYRASAPDLARTRQTGAILKHMIETSHAGLAHVEVRDDACAEFMNEVADKHSLAGKTELAEQIYSRVLEARPGNGKANRHLADLLQRGRLFGMAMAMNRRNAADPGIRNEWTFLNLAEMLAATARPTEAAGLVRMADALYPGKVSIRSKLRGYQRDAFWSVWRTVADRAEANGIAATQAELRTVLANSTPEFEAVQRGTPVRRVALVGNEDLPQCKLYRIDQKKEHLEAAGFTVEVFNAGTDLARYVARLADFDAVIFFRVAAFPDIIDAIVKSSDYGVVTFYEIDDVVFDTEHFPPAYENYAGQITERQYGAMACGVPLFDHAMRLCDYGIASTTPLQEMMAARVRTGEVFLHRNALGRVHMQAIADAGQRPASADAPVRIFYGSGTKAHKQDFAELVEPALASICDTYGDKVQVLLIGHFGSFKHLDPRRHNVKVLQPIWNFEQYAELLSRMDINLSVLAPSLITDAKSEIKWMEAAMFGIPSVVSATATHAEVIRHGETGYLCDTVEDFTAALSVLVGEPATRARVGAAARAAVMAGYSIETQAANIASIMATVRPKAAPKQRVLIVNVFYPPQAIGGATRVVHDNVMELKAHYGDRYEIDVLCTLEGGGTPYEVTSYGIDGIRVTAITAANDPKVDSMATDPRMARIFAQYLRDNPPDLIHFHCIQRLTASIAEEARRARIPYLITAHDGWWISPNQFLINDRDEVETYAYHVNAFGVSTADDDRAEALRRPLLGAAHVLAVSDAFANIYRDAGVTNVMTLENGVSHLPQCDRHPSASGRVRLAHIGGVSRHKGIHLVRNALLGNAYENLELLIVDHALPKGAVRTTMWGTTPVTMVPKTDMADIGDLYAQIDVLLAPSVWPESYGLVTREALATGAWVIASDRGAVGASVQDGVNGHIVDAANYEALARVLWLVDRSPETYRHPPAVQPDLRTVSAQVAELVGIYDSLLPHIAASAAPAAAV